jgi:hypothetical protein
VTQPFSRIRRPDEKFVANKKRKIKNVVICERELHP